MKFLSLTLLAVIPASFTRASPDIFDFPKNFFNNQVVPWIVKELSPTIAKEVEVTFQESVQATLGIIPETVNKTIEESISKPWGRRSKIASYFLEPLRAKAKQIKAKMDQDIHNMVSVTSTEAKIVAIDAIKKGVSDFLSVGKEHPAKPIAVNLTASWPLSAAQEKVEQLHAEVMHYMRPDMAKFMQGQKATISKFLMDEIRYIKSVLFKREPRFKSTKKLQENIITKLHSLLVRKVEQNSGTMLKESLLMTNKMLRPPSSLHMHFFLIGRVQQAHGNPASLAPMHARR